MIQSRQFVPVVLCLCALIMAGCAGGYLGFWQRQNKLKKEYQQEPSAELLRQLDPQDCFLIAGPFTFKHSYTKPVLIVAVTDRFKKRDIAAKKILQAGVFYYQAYVPEGRYHLYFFADLDDNGFFEAHEMIGRTTGDSVQVSRSEVKDDLTVPGPALTLDPVRPAAIDLPVRVRVQDQAYAFNSLDDAFFDPQYGSLGLYDPMAFMAHTQRYVFALEKIDPRKTLVLFVHGLEGTPRDFKYLVAGLDTNRYQPLFFFYPSGMPLQKLGSLLAGIIRYLTSAEYFHAQRIIVVAHSLGGLVGLSALNQLCIDGAPSYLLGYISFNAPYGGVTGSLQIAVKNAPAVVPSWRDVAIGSPFLEQLYKGPATGAMPFYLFFGYKTGNSSDGTVTLQSQLEPRVHLKASKSYGFNATHVGILHDEAARQQFNHVLEELEN